MIRLSEFMAQRAPPLLSWVVRRAEVTNGMTALFIARRITQLGHWVVSGRDLRHFSASFPHPVSQLRNS